MSDSPHPAPNWRLNTARVAVVLLLIGLTAAVYVFRDRVRELQGLGYPGLFLINLIASASIVLPIPALPIVAGMAILQTNQGVYVFNPWLLGIVAAVGATLGELSGYLAGRSGTAIIDQTALYQRLHAWTERYGVLTLSVLAFIPNPLFDMAGIAAGTLKMSLPKFLLATLIGKLPKMWLTAFAGIWGLEWLLRMFGL